MAFNKRFRANPIHDLELHPLPATLKKGLELMGKNFSGFYMRNLNIMDTSEQDLYGIITHYEGSNICWIQPTRVKSMTAVVEYDRYIKAVNKAAKEDQLKSIICLDVQIGMDCLAQYESDNHWYRGIVVEVAPDGWLVLFVDYGNFQVCSQFQLKYPLRSKDVDHFHAPTQAVCCRLYNIVPRQADNRDEIDRRLENFYTTRNDEFVELKVANIREDSVVDVDVFISRKDTKGEERLYLAHIGQSLVDDGIATFADPKAARQYKSNPPEPDYELPPSPVPKKEPDDDCCIVDTKPSIHKFEKTEPKPKLKIWQCAPQYDRETTDQFAVNAFGRVLDNEIRPMQFTFGFPAGSPINISLKRKTFVEGPDNIDY